MNPWLGFSNSGNENSKRSRCIPFGKISSFLFFSLLPIYLFATLGCTVDRYFIFFPSRSVNQNPKDVGIAYEEITLKTSDGLNLNAWFIEKKEAKGTMIWFHGNGGNIGDRVGHIKLFYESLPVDLLILDYRGYGKSEGSPSEEGTYHDAEAALAYVHFRQKAPQKIIYYGQSLGSAIAVELGIRNPPHGLILESPFTSIRDMARVAYPFLPLGFLIQTEYDSMSKIGGIKSPILILHGDRDEIVPWEQGKSLFEAAPEPKTFFTLPGASHNDTFYMGGEPYLRELGRFIHSVLE